MTRRCFNLSRSQGEAKFTQFEYEKAKLALSSSLLFVFSLTVCSMETHLEGPSRATSPSLLVSQALKTLKKAYGREFTALCQPSPCYKSLYKHTLSRSNLQACLPDALSRSETCQSKS